MMFGKHSPFVLKPPCWEDYLMCSIVFSQSLMLQYYPANLQSSYEFGWWKELRCERQDRCHEAQSGIWTPDPVAKESAKMCSSFSVVWDSEPQWIASLR